VKVKTASISGESNRGIALSVDLRDPSAR